jgi:cytochrome c-type biogenesis protein CcmE
MRKGRNKWQFAIGIVIILTTIGWLAYSGIQESKTYYVTVSELLAAPETAHRRFRVAGDVATGSIQRSAGRVEFQLVQGAQLLPIVYTGTDPLPDTLRDGAQAVADGRYDNGTFHAEAVQAKCASKYEAMEATANANADADGSRAAPKPGTN